jgi:hypothetical protein
LASPSASASRERSTAKSGSKASRGSAAGSGCGCRYLKSPRARASRRGRRRRRNGEPAAAPIGDDREPKLCPALTKEPETTKTANSIAYQEYVSGLRCGWAIILGIVRFDGCDETTGFLLEAKADLDFMVDDNDELYW